MNKTRKQIVEVERFSHDFYCDECEKYLGRSEEYDDGFYNIIGEFEMRIFLPEGYGWYEIKRCLCEECKKKYLSIFSNDLINHGFNKE